MVKLLDDVGCGCVKVGKPTRFMTSATIWFFWLLLLTINYTGEPFTHSWECKRSPPTLDLRVPPSGFSWWQQWHWALRQ